MDLILTLTEIIMVVDLEEVINLVEVVDLEEVILEEDLEGDTLEMDIIEDKSIYKVDILTHLYQFQAIKHQYLTKSTLNSLQIIYYKIILIIENLLII